MPVKNLLLYCHFRFFFFVNVLKTSSSICSLHSHHTTEWKGINTWIFCCNRIKWFHAVHLCWCNWFPPLTNSFSINKKWFKKGNHTTMVLLIQGRRDDSFLSWSSCVSLDVFLICLCRITFYIWFHILTSSLSDTSFSYDK